MERFLDRWDAAVDRGQQLMDDPAFQRLTQVEQDRTLRELLDKDCDRLLPVT